MAMLMNGNPVDEFIRQQGCMVLDGGLATALEELGCDLDDELWSAKILLEAPERIRQVHLDFLRAGADCIATASYQANIAGFRRRGLDNLAALDLLRRSVRLAVEARDEFWNDPANRAGRLRPLVAASIGPYGAFLADGSEYTGRYGVSDHELFDFHRERWHILAASGADLMGCETIPSLRETRILLELLGETGAAWAWMSFSCCDARHLCDGSPLVQAARLCDAEERVAAVGVNCVAPERVPALIGELRKTTQKPIMAYPNSGERYDADTKAWSEPGSRLNWGDAAAEWYHHGASVIGGCCRVGFAVIAEIRRHLVA